MTTHTASCRCGQLHATTTGEPVRVSVCHCLDCKKRRAAPSRCRRAGRPIKSRIEGHSKSFVKVADSGNRATFHFCPDCGSTCIMRSTASSTRLVAIPLGAFDDPLLRQPGLFGVGRTQARLGRHHRREHRAPGLISRPRRRVDAQEIAAHQLLQPRLAPAALRRSRRSGGSGRRCYSPRPADRRRRPRPAPRSPPSIRCCCHSCSFFLVSASSVVRKHAIVGADADMVLAGDIGDMLDMGEQVARPWDGCRASGTA